MSLDILYVAWNRLAFTKWSWKMLMENTDWSLVDRLVVHDDGSTDGTTEWLTKKVEEAPVATALRSESLRSPPAVMNRYVAESDVDWFAKIDNDIIVPPDWLNNMTGVLERNPEVELLGMEAGRGNSRHEDWDGVYRFEPGSHMGGVGLIRVDSLRQRVRMNERTGRFGWTEWQQEYSQVVRGWINPDIAAVSLDRVPFQPWISLAEKYVANDWSRPWGTYHVSADYWDWWPKSDAPMTFPPQPAIKPKLVASMLVKNELGRYLQASIGSLRDFCDLIVVLDDGSTDRTSEWLDDNADDKMVVRPEPAAGFFDGHEGRRRQALLDLTLEHAESGDYVLAIDADEFVRDGQKVRDFCATGQPLGTLDMQEVWEKDKAQLRVRVDGGWRPHGIPILWRIPPVMDERWRIQDRALACGREPMAVRDLLSRARPTGTDILHFGWSNEAERADRYQRYVEADGGKFHNRRHLDSIMWEGRRVVLREETWPKGLKLRDDVVVYERSLTNDGP